MKLAGKYANLDLGSINGLDIVEAYKSGNHLLYGGPEVGFFWATAVSALGTHRPKPIEHAIQVLSEPLRGL